MRSTLAFCGILLLAPLTLAAQEFPVNTVTTGDQRCPVVVAHPEGGYLTVFASDTPDNPVELQGVFGQRFGLSGERIGPALTFVSGELAYCLAAVPSGPGRLLVVWGVFDGISNGFGRQAIYARHFDVQGNPLSPRFQAGEGMSYLPPGAACDAEGRCWISWIGQRVESVRARRFDLSGEPLSEEIRLDAPGGPGGLRWNVELAADPQGGFLASWGKRNTETPTPETPLPPPNEEFHIRRVSAAGELLGEEIAITPTDPGNPGAPGDPGDPGDTPFAYSEGAVCPAAAGGLLVATSRVRIDLGSPDDILLRRFDASGAPVDSGRVVASSGSPRSLEQLSLACGPNRLLLLWTESRPSGGSGLFGRFFSLSGEPSGAPFLISEPGGRSSAVLSGPAHVFAAWEAHRSGSIGMDIFGRTYLTAAPLSLHGGRFKVEATFRDPRTGVLAQAEPRPLTDDTGLFWFFDGANLELVVKALDGCEVNGHFWVFAAGLTDVEAEITVTDTVSGSWKTYRNPPRTAFLPIQDTRAFDCP
jgi:hypothetical protein